MPRKPPLYRVRGGNELSVRLRGALVRARVVDVDLAAKSLTVEYLPGDEGHAGAPRGASTSVAYRDVAAVRQYSPAASQFRGLA